MPRSLEPVRRAQASALAMVPALFAPRPDAAKRFLEFFAAQIRNPNTRKAYFRAVSRFAAWCELNGLTELVDLEPVHVAAYVEQLGKQLSPPSVKQHLAAIRMLCDWLVVGQVIATNPAAPVRGPRHVVRKGKTPVLAAEEARTLLDSIPGDTVVGMRDRALIALDGLHVRAGRCGHQDAVRGCLRAGSAHLGAVARERRQAARDALPSLARYLPRRVHRRRPISPTSRRAGCFAARGPARAS